MSSDLAYRIRNCLQRLEYVCTDAMEKLPKRDVKREEFEDAIQQLREFDGELLEVYLDELKKETSAA